MTKRKYAILEIGIMWVDINENKDPFKVVAEAIAHYTARYGKKPELCHVHPDMFGDEKAIAVKALADRSQIGLIFDGAIRERHVWTGVAR